MFENVRLDFGAILENLRKSSEGGRKSSENHQKCRHQHIYIIKRTVHGGTCKNITRGITTLHVAKIVYINIVLPLENKIHIFAPPCNILYTHVYFTSLYCTRKYELNKLTSLAMCGFIAQLVEHRTCIRGGHGFESR